MKSRLLTISLIFLIINGYKTECSQRTKVSGQKRTRTNDNDSYQHRINTHDVNAVIEHFTTTHQAFIASFKRHHPGQKFNELQSFRPTIKNGLLASWCINYASGANLYCSQIYSSKKIRSLLKSKISDQ